MTYSVTVELVNGTKYYKMSPTELLKFLDGLEDTTKRFIEIPSDNIRISIDKIVYVWYRELRNGE